MRRFPSHFRKGLPGAGSAPVAHLSPGWLGCETTTPARAGPDDPRRPVEATGHEGDTPSFARLARALSSMKIGFGRERYLAILDEHAEASRRRSADPESLRDEDGELDTRRRSLEERLNEFQYSSRADRQVC